MKNETEHKKEYSIPTVRVVELKHQGQLLEASSLDPFPTGVELI